MGIPIGSPRPSTFWSVEDDCRKAIAATASARIQSCWGESSCETSAEIFNKRKDEAFEHDPEYQRLLASVDAKPTGLLGRIRNFFW